MKRRRRSSVHGGRDDLGPADRCQFARCRRPAFILDKLLGMVVCHLHRQWPCEACGAKHQHRELIGYRDDMEYSLSCPGTRKVVFSDYWSPYVSLPSNSTLGDICFECLGLGRCQCVGTGLGKHERCVRCDGNERCIFCRGTGLKSAHTATQDGQGDHGDWG